MKERLAGAPPWALPLATVVLRRAIIGVLIGLAAVWAFHEVSSLLALVLLAFFFSLALDPAVTWLAEHRGMRRGAATGVVFGLTVLFGVVVVGLLIPLTIELTTKLGDVLPHWVDTINEVAEHLTGRVLISADRTQDASIQLGDAVSNWFGELLGSALGIASTGLSLAFNLATLALFTFYFTAGGPALRRALSSRLAEDTRDRFNWAWDIARDQTGGYFYSRLLLMVINGSLFFVVLLLLGTPVAFALPLAIFEGFVAEFIPAVGTYIGAAVPIVFVLAETGFAQAVILVLWTIIYQQVENAWLSPRISSQTMSLNAGVAFGSALAGGALFGPIGAFVALPVAGMVTSMVATYTRSYDLPEGSGEPGNPGEASGPADAVGH
jgi:predicted PurR-regulated permease PerM